MKLLDLVAVLVRLLVLVLLYQMLGSLPKLASQIAQWQHEADYVRRGLSPWYNAVGLVWEALILLVVFRFPLTMARLLVPPSSRDIAIEGGNTESLQRAGFVLLGIYMATWGVVDIFGNATIMLELSSRGLSDGDFYVRTQGYLVATVAQIIAGLYLMLGSGGLQRFIRGTRD